MHVNKVHHVRTISRVAKDLGEDEEWLFDVANEMDVEDGVIWVYGDAEESVCGFRRSRPGIPSIIRAPFQSDGAHHSNLMPPRLV
jgi:hypothetical protein